MIAKPSYFPVLDGLRGIAALLVVIRHVPELFSPFAFQESYLAVDLFFCLSGVVLCINYETRLHGGLTSGRFALIRAIRLYPLYILGTAIGLVAASMLVHPSARSVVLAILMVPDLNLEHRGLYAFNTPAWSLTLEAAVSFVYGSIGFRLTSAMIWRMLLGTFLVLLAALVLTPEHNLNIGWSNRTFFGGIPRIVFSFSIGVLIGRSMIHYRPPVELPMAWLRRSASVDTFATLLLFAVVYALLTASPGQHLQWLYDLFVVAILFPLVVAFSIKVRPGASMTAICRWLGIISFPVYALHQPLGQLLQNVCLTNGIVCGDSAPFVGALFLVTLIGIATLVDRMFDRPVRRALMTAAGRLEGTTPRPDMPSAAHV